MSTGVFKNLIRLQSFSAHLLPAPNRNLYRQWLRELGYFPDRVAATHLREQVSTRFRSSPGLLAFQGHDILYLSDPDLQRHMQRLLTSARLLRTLEKANVGDKRATAKVLDYAYGRTGRRKHDLLVPFVPPIHQWTQRSKLDLVKALNAGVPKEIPDDVLLTPQEEKDEDKCQSVANGPLPSIDLRLLRTLCDSQAQELSAGRKVPKVKLLSFPGSWDRITSGARLLRSPNARRRAFHRHVRRIYRVTSVTLRTKVLPPLPSAEWEYLRSIVAGKVSLETIPRRAMGTSRWAADEDVAPAAKWPSRSARWRRRMWGKTFQKCPMLVPGESDYKHKVVWPELENEVSAKLDTKFFEGVDWAESKDGDNK